MSENEMIELYDKKIHIMQTLEMIIGPKQMEIIYELLNVQKKLDSIEYCEIEVI